MKHHHENHDHEHHSEGFGPRGFAGPGPRRGPFGRGGFGPGGPGFGPGGPGFGPGRFGPFRAGGPQGPGEPGPEGRGFGPGGRGFGPGGPGGRGRGRGSRRQRGNVRAAVLALLAEEPRHGYAVMTELAERSGGLWRPSPGSIYPVLQQLQDEGLVVVREDDGRRVFSLTDAGQTYVTEHADEIHEPWVVADSEPVDRIRSLMHAVAGLEAAVDQVARLGTPEQAQAAVAAVDEARRSIYRILAEDEPAAPAARPAPGDAPSATQE